MTAWTIRGWLAVLVVAAALQGVLPSEGEHQRACAAEYASFIAISRARRGESQAARDSLLDRLDALDRRHRRYETDCAAELWQQRAILEGISGRYDRVIDVVTRFLASPVRRRVPDVTARMYSNRGNALYMLGATAEANEDLFRSAALARQVGAPAAAASLAQAAESAALYGDWAGANAYLTQARTILLDSLPFRPDLELRLGRLAAGEAGLLAHRLRGETDEARQRGIARRLLAVADTAVAILERSASDDPVQNLYDDGDRALALADGAYAAAVMGRRDEAQRRLRAATALIDAEMVDYYPGAALEVWKAQWTIEALTGNMAAAMQTARRARYAAADLEDVETEAQALEALASFHESAGRLAVAEQQYVAASRLRDVQWQRNRLHDWSAATFASAQAPFRGLARLYVHAGRVEDAFAILDGSRARALRDLRSELERRERLTPARRAEADSLLENIQTLRLAAFRNTLDAAGRSAAVARLSALQRRLTAVTASDAGPIGRLDLDALQQALRQQRRTLISYLMDEHQSMAFVVTPDTLVARVLPVGSVEVRRWMAEAGGPWSPRGDAALHLAPLHRLHEALIRPLAADLPEGTALVVVPDGPLSDLPFGLLVDAPSESYSEAAFLIRTRPVSVELAAALVADQEPESRGRREPLLAFGRSEFGTAPAGWRGRGGQPLADLPNVAREIERVGSHVGRARLALNDDATEARLSTRLDHARIVHLASHAQANAASPPLSRIFLWDDPDDPDDGVLHLYELQARHLQADLIVLSGCSTADGQSQAGEGTLSLQYGVRAAGARAALATLWPVDDRAMADVMDVFYGALADGLPKDRALQQAQVAYLDTHDGLEASPFYWGALVLSGDVAPVPLGTPGSGPWPFAVGLAVLAGGALAWTLARRRHARRSAPTL